MCRFPLRGKFQLVGGDFLIFFIGAIASPAFLKFHLSLLSQYFDAVLNQSLHSDNKTHDFIYKQSEPTTGPPAPAPAPIGFRFLFYGIGNKAKTKRNRRKGRQRGPLDE